MKLYSENKNYKLYHGNMLDMLEVIELNTIDSIVTDPPYELNFMGKGWDNAGISFNKETWEKCFEVLKPGGYLLAFGGSRTYHRIAVAIEDAGFEIRDTIMWLYGSGFPKSMNIAKGIEAKLTKGNANKTQFSELNGEKLKRGDWGIAKNSKEYGFRSKDYTTETEKTERLGKLEPTTELAKQWEDWGTCLKPSFEPIIVARKPFKGSLVDNVIENGVGGLNIDECRVGTEVIKGGTMPKMNSQSDGINLYNFGKKNAERLERQDNVGRFPANTILTYDETDFGEVCGGFPITGKESSSRYFYCAKASKKDRDEGLDRFETKQCTGGGGGIGDYLKDVNSCSGKFGSEKAPHKNTHPTVKPTELMQYLVRLVTPNGGTILDPFNGSGSTGKAVMYENKERNKNYKYIGIELTEEYLPIAQARIEFVCGKEEKAEPNQTTIFDYEV